MTEAEIQTKLQNLPYTVPADIQPRWIKHMMIQTDIDGDPDNERKFWDHLQQATPEQQAEFFKMARASKQGGQALIWAVLCFGGFFGLVALRTC